MKQLFLLFTLLTIFVSCKKEPTLEPQQHQNPPDNRCWGTISYTQDSISTEYAIGGSILIYLIDSTILPQPIIQSSMCYTTLAFDPIGGNTKLTNNFNFNTLIKPFDKPFNYWVYIEVTLMRKSNSSTVMYKMYKKVTFVKGKNTINLNLIP